jgi:ferredoxin
LSEGDYLLYFSIACAAILVLVVIKIFEMSRDEEGWWTRSILEGRRVKVDVEWNLCLGSGTCTELAPGIFHLDWAKKKSVFDPAPLEMTEDASARAEDIFRAAQSCPYRAIIMKDADNGDRLFPI